jgi:uncharacterized protein (TIGR03000 family)
MKNMGLRNILLGALVATCAVALAAEDAHAFWGSRGSWGSYGGSWGSSGSSGGSWGSSGGSWGSGGGLFHRRGWGSCGSSGGSYGSSGGSWGSCGSSGGSYGSSGGSYGGGYASYDSNVVYSDGSYAVQSAPVQQQVVVNTTPAVKTTLKLRVPADAKVTLAGVATKQTGEVREFTTTKLASGQSWNNYDIHIEVTRDGRTLTEDRHISLTGGQSQDLAVDFGGVQVASLNH